MPLGVAGGLSGERLAPQVSSDSVDGVSVFWAPCEGPLRARLAFRVGQADETLVNHGITHLIEHLTLTGLGQPTYQFNGSVDDVRTTFDFMGSPSEAVQFFEGVTNGLRALPEQRVEVEKRLLQTEQDNVGGPLDALDRARYGPRGYGLHVCRELGLEWLGASDLDAWSAQRFTAANATLWLSGPLPEGLRLHLAAGDRIPAPDPRPRASQHLTWRFEGDRGVGLTALGSRGWPLLAGAW